MSVLFVKKLLISFLLRSDTDLPFVACVFIAYCLKCLGDHNPSPFICPGLDIETGFSPLGILVLFV